jgi:hypothetical protein
MRTGERLPAEVEELAERLGGKSACSRSRVVLKQNGRLLKPRGIRRVPFTATQVVDLHMPAFAWRASLGHMRAIRVTDSLVDGVACHETRIFGVPIKGIREPTTHAHEWMIRYLLTLPWVPDAIVCNRNLQWTVSDPDTIRVRAHCGDVCAEVILRLNAEGRIEAADALEIDRYDAEFSVEDAWRARFSVYQHDEGQMVPSSCEFVRRSKARGMEMYEFHVTDRHVT